MKLERRSFAWSVIASIRRIPRGRVATYGQIAAMAARDPLAARQVAWILHSSSKKYGLPWHRVVNRNGCISLPPGGGYEEQKALLEGEGIVFSLDGKIDLARFLWKRRA